MVQWGKAQGKFMTVPGVEHFHVFVRGVPEEIVQKWVWPFWSVLMDVLQGSQFPNLH